MILPPIRPSNKKLKLTFLYVNLLLKPNTKSGFALPKYCDWVPVNLSGIPPAVLMICPSGVRTKAEPYILSVRSPTFKNVFKLTKDITLLFNEPGDNYKSKLLSNTYKKHTKEIIMNTDAGKITKS